MFAVNHPSIPEQDPRYTEALALHQAGKPADALPLYEGLYQRWPYHAHLLASLGTCKMQLGDLKGGLDLLDQALVFSPDLGFALTNRASALAAQGRHNEALEAYQALPDSADVLSQRGGILARMDRFEEALAAYDAAIEKDPTRANYQHDRGLVLAKLHRHEEALAAYESALLINPRFAEAYASQGKMLNELKRSSEAVISFNAALALDTRNLNAYSGLCTALVDLKLYDEALKTIDEALLLQPGKELFLYKAVVLYHAFDYAGALSCTEQALAFDDHCAASWAHRGYVLMAMKRFTEAQSCYHRALTLNPEGNDENWAHALLTLASGDYLSGWPLYEWRWQREEGKGYVQQWPKAPRWLGEWSIQGKTLLVMCEQGMGDTLQFCRFIPTLISLGAKVKLAVQKPLVNLLRSLHPNVDVMALDAGIGSFDFFTPLLSLPLALKTTLHTLPCLPYLKADQELVSHWREHLGLPTRPRIGIAWSGNPNPKSDHKRTIPLKELEPILAKDCDFYVLQRDIRSSDNLTDYPNLHYLPEALNGFDQTAGLAMNMDSIITIDTSITHLVGALGLPTLVLLPYHACFRWLADRDDSPWYPSLHLIRQTTPGDWRPVIDQAANIFQSVSQNESKIHWHQQTHGH